MLSVSSQRKYNFYHQNTFLDAVRTNSRNIIGRNPSMVIPLLANQDLNPMLVGPLPSESAILCNQLCNQPASILKIGLCLSLNQRLKDDKLMIEADFTESHKTDQLHAIQIEYFWNHCFGISKEIYNSKLSDMIATESVTTLT